MIRNLFKFSFTPVAFGDQVRRMTFLHRPAIRAIKENLDKPKGAVNGYTLFYQEKYPEMKRQFPNFGVLDIGKRAGAAWNALSDIEKKKYADRAAKLGEQTKADMAEYQENLTSRQKLARRAIHFHNQYVRGLVKRAEIPREIKDFVKGLPAKPFETGRQMFIASKLRGQKNATTLMQAAAKEWDGLPAADKKKFDDRAHADTMTFQANLNTYINL